MCRFQCVLVAVCLLHCTQCFILESSDNCPAKCTCSETSVGCQAENIHGWPVILQNADFLQSLNLQDNPHLGNIPHGAFDSFQQSLTHLFLGNTGLTQVPPDTKHLQNLTLLDMSNNTIGDRGFPDDAFGIGPMAIIYLFLRNTSLTEIPLALCSLNSLHTLYLDRNDMKMISDEQASCIRNVTELHMRDCGMSWIPSSFRLLTKLNTLRLSNNPLRRIEHYDLFGLTNLRSLVLPNTSISYISPGAFQWTQSLQSLSLNYNNITDVPYAFMVLNDVRVNLENNHVCCSCDLIWAIDWMNSTSSRIFGDCENHALTIEKYTRTALPHCPS